MNKITDFIKYIAYNISRIFDYLPIKGFLAAVYVCYDFFLGGTLNPFAIRSIMFLVIVDFITGLSAAKLSGEEIRSSKVVRSAIKFVVYLLLIASAHITEYAVPVIAGFGDETIVAFLALTELISVIENVGKMGYAVPKKLLNKLQDIRDGGIKS